MFCLIENKSFKLIVNKSVFVAYSFSVSSYSEFKANLNYIKNSHKSFSHFPYALRLFNKEIIEEFFSDDQEPNKTAGLPILSLLRQKNLVNTGIVVARYFGGVKLGVSLLRKSFVESAKQVLENNIKDFVEMYQNTFSVDIERFKLVKEFLLKNRINFKPVFRQGVVEISVNLELNNKKKYIKKNKLIDFFNQFN